MRLFFKGGILLQIMFCIVLFASIWTNISIYTILIFSICIVLFVPVLRYIDKIAIFIFLFSISYTLIMLVHDVASWANWMSYLICPTLFYCYGKYVVDKANGDARSLVSFWCISILLFSSVLYISALQDILENGFINVMRNFTIWGVENSSLSATLYGLIASLGLVGLPFFFIDTNSKSNTRYLFLALSALSLVTVIHLVNRTGLIVLFICFVITTLYYSKGKLSHFFILFLVIGLVVFILLQQQILSKDIVDAYLARNEGVGSVNTAGGRFVKWSTALNNLFIYPFGWSYANIQYGYVHNLWLDIARVAGSIPFLFFIIATIQSFAALIRLLRIKERIITPLILGLNICFFLSSFVEPVIDAIALYFYLYVMLWGMQSQLFKLYRVYGYNRVEIWR